MLGAIERLYPKREPGEHWKRGRATGETYRYAEVVKDLLMHGYRALLPSEEHEAEVKKCERVLAKGNISNHTRETYERRLENLRNAHIINKSYIVHRQPHFPMRLPCYATLET